VISILVVRSYTSYFHIILTNYKDRDCLMKDLFQDQTVLVNCIHMCLQDNTFIINIDLVLLEK